ncbi:hypothetical protein ANN_00405 [Periplaneta americana]|uniref:Uncharacterized protein n=1 Tax=Periplaneta americana TaxID=6978 RepID=A0ABQ8TT39_PERAM|nr:hypothetical protein ANN_00405 [Periplaneta americana]
MDLREVGYDDRDWINLAQDRDRWRAYVTGAQVGCRQFNSCRKVGIHDAAWLSLGRCSFSPLCEPIANGEERRTKNAIKLKIVICSIVAFVGVPFGRCGQCDGAPLLTPRPYLIPITPRFDAACWELVWLAAHAILAATGGIWSLQKYSCADSPHFDSTQERDYVLI